MKKIFSVLLLAGVIILGLIFSSCNNTDGEKNDVNSGDVISENTEKETEKATTYPAPSLPDNRYDNQFFTVLVRNNNGSGCDDIYAEVDSGDSLKEAVYQRNMVIEDKYGLTIREVWASDQEVDQRLYNSVASNEKDFDMVDINFLQTYTAASNGLLLDLNDIEYLDLNNPWWDKQINEDCSIGGKQFYAIGDANVSAVKGTWVLAYNQKLITDMGYDNDYIYNLVRDGKWTIDQYYALAKGFTKDLNQDSLMTADDQYALSGNGSSIIGFMSCAGVIITQKDADDFLEFCDLTDYTNDVLTKLGKALSPSLTYNIDAADHFATDQGTGAHINIFKENRALFFSECLSTMEVFRDMESDFGIIPHPKYSEKEEYSSFLHQYVGTAFGIPITAPDLQKTAIMMEYMSFLSTDSVLPSYYSRVLEGKNTRDAESYEMITEYIIPKRKYDIGFSNAFGGLMFDIYGQISTGTNAFASTYRRLHKSVISEIDTANEAFS